MAIKARLVENYGLETKTIMNTMYKTMAKKVKIVATQLSLDFKDYIKKVEEELTLKETRKIEYNYMMEILTK